MSERLYLSLLFSSPNVPCSKSCRKTRNRANSEERDDSDFSGNGVQTSGAPWIPLTPLDALKEEEDEEEENAAACCCDKVVFRVSMSMVSGIVSGIVCDAACMALSIAAFKIDMSRSDIVPCTPCDKGETKSRPPGPVVTRGARGGAGVLGCRCGRPG